MKAPPFTYHRPDTLDDALALLAEHGDDAKILAGGQSLIPLMGLRMGRPEHVVDIGRIPGLSDITINDDRSVTLGAMVRHEQANLDQSRHVGTLRDAAADHKVVHIVYRSVGKEETTERDIEPWSVFVTLGRWYVHGHCRLVGGSRTFRVDRIRELQVLDETFERPEKVPTPGVGYLPSKDDVTCVIELDARARWVLEYYPVEVIRESSTTTRIRFHSPDAEVPARLLLRLGSHARLVEGAEVAVRIGEIGAALLSRYQ